MIARTDPTKAKSAAPDQENALFTVTNSNHTAEKELANIRARLCLSGGQRLHIAEDNFFFVTTPFGQIFRFNDLSALAAHADRGAR